MLRDITVIPAYGSDYKSVKAVREAFDSNRDFAIVDFFSGAYGRYINKADLNIGDSLRVRYAKQTKVCIVEKTA